MRKYDVVIIGAGSAGLSARREVEKKTDNYLVIDGGILGTTCARVGCMPSKVLIQAAEDFHRRDKLLEEGIHGGENLTIDTKELMTHVRKLRDRFVRGVHSGMSNWKSDKHFLGSYTHFIDPHTLEVDGEKIHAEKIIIATGSSPIIPEQLKPFKEFTIDTNSFFELEDLPKSMAVVGLGVIGMELGQALDRVGVNVVGIARRKRIAGISDPKLTDYVADKFSEEMNLDFSGIKNVEQVGDQLKLTLESGEYLVDKILVTSGRSVNVENLKLDNLNIKLDSKGLPKYSKTNFSLDELPHIFIAGDVNGQRPILHDASDEGVISGFNSVAESLTNFKTRTPLAITFSDPNIASVGKSYQELIDEKSDFAIGEVSFEGQGRAIVKLKEIGMLRIYGDKKSGKILGSELFAPSGEHLAHLISWAIAMNLSVNETISLPFYHPVVEEGLRTALRDLRDKVNEERPSLEVNVI